MVLAYPGCHGKESIEWVLINKTECVRVSDYVRAFSAIPLSELELFYKVSVRTIPQLFGQWRPHVRQTTLLT